MRMMVFGACLLLCGSASAGELAGSELRDELVGQTIQWWEDGGWHAGNLALMPDGRARITVESPSETWDDGRWSISGNQLCTSWTSLRGQETKCYTVMRAGPNRFVTSGGNVFVVLTAGA